MAKETAAIVKKTTTPAVKKPAVAKKAVVARPVAKKAAPSKPAAKKPVVVSKPLAKPAAKAPVATSPAPVKPVATPVAKAKPSVPEVKVRKPKLVRDSFTMPESEYEVLGDVKKACLKAGIATKKSELLRVGVALIRKMDTAQLKAAIAALAPVKAGRPKKDK